MELQTVDRQLPVFDCRHRAGVGGGQGQEVARSLRHLISVAHPDVDLVGNAREQSIALGDPAAGAAVFSGGRALHLAPQCLTGQVQPVADAQDRQPKAENFGVALGRARLVHAGRAARKDNPPRGQFADPLGRDVVADDLAIDLLLPHPPGDQLRILRAKIQDQDFFIRQPCHCLPLRESRLL